MSAVVAIATVELRRFLRDKSNLFFVFIFPLMLILLLGSQFGAGSGQPRVTIAGPGSTLAQTLTAELVSAGVQAVGLDRSQLAALTGAGIPKDQARPALDQAAAQVAAPTVEIVDTGDVVQEFRGWGKFDLGASQQLLLFVFLSSLTGAATLIQARRLGVVGRVMSAPVSSGQIVAGQGLGRFAIAFVQGGFIMVGTAVLFGVDWGNLWLSALVLVLFCAASAAAAMMVGSVMDNDTAAAGVGVGAGLVLAGLGGCTVPPEFFPEALDAISFATPHRWAYEAFASIQRHDGTLGDVLAELGVLAGMAAALLVLGAWLLRRSLNRAL
ncbi:ABC transporter permease [Arthrobacter sp. AL12]|uniref:ABC transporter permease n=1 Tax=Arthrobacter sp. AL12 TaxID=3042241 RepID=UPI00249A94BC|nr:ABC transporter permease [Arthrobacter sp. AL12]MDI3212826.1 ABC transporter permease [Arthrobacter sp. AL12]